MHPWGWGNFNQNVENLCECVTCYVQTKCCPMLTSLLLQESSNGLSSGGTCIDQEADSNVYVSTTPLSEEPRLVDALVQARTFMEEGVC